MAFLVGYFFSLLFYFSKNVVLCLLSPREETKGTVENGDLEKEKVSVAGPRHRELRVQLLPGVWGVGRDRRAPPNQLPEEEGTAH